MTDYEILMIMLTLLALLFTACGFLLALLSFLDKRNNKLKNKASLVCKQERRLSLRAK